MYPVGEVHTLDYLYFRASLRTAPGTTTYWVRVAPEHHVAIQHAHAFGLPVRIALVVEQLPDLKLAVDPLQTLHPPFYQVLRDLGVLNGHHFPEPFEMHAHRNFERT